jgi:PIN domain nuclease of toxin-antitoxin system
MTGLLDTHVFLWAIVDDPRLSPRHREIFADAQSILFLSHASIWEILVKVGMGKLEMPKPTVPYLQAQLERTESSPCSSNWRIWPA